MTWLGVFPQEDDATAAETTVPDLSVVVPCYNEEEGIEEFHARMSQACISSGRSFEILYVDDGSTDGTLEKVRRIASEDAEHRVVVVELARNHGHQLALTAGLSVCNGGRILILDADLQDSPELLEPMWEMMDEKHLDVVYGKRRSRAGETAFKLATASAFYWLIDAMSEQPIPRDTGDFRLMSRRALHVLLSMPEKHRFIRGMVSWIGFAQAPFEYDRDSRYAGVTKYPLSKMLRFAADAITSFSVKPLRMATYVGLFFAGVAAPLLLFYAVLSWAVFKFEPGWPSLLGAVALLGGIQLLVLGIIGEYVGRIFEQVKQRPLFMISEIHRGGMK